jgi:hypothetical protein
MGYIKGFDGDFPGVRAEPIVIDRPDGTHDYLGWNILLTTSDTVKGDLTVSDSKGSFTFAEVQTINQADKGEILLYSHKLYVN